MCWTSLYTGNKTNANKIKKHTQYNMCWTSQYTGKKTNTNKIKKKTQDNMCWTLLYTGNKTNTNKIKKTHNTICVGHHYTQETRRIQTK